MQQISKCRLQETSYHQELWVPADKLDEFNQHLVGHIEVIAAYFGSQFIGTAPEEFVEIESPTATNFLQVLMYTFEYNGMDFRTGVVMNFRSVYCNYAYWKTLDLKELEYKEPMTPGILLDAIASAIHGNFWE